MWVKFEFQVVSVHSVNTISPSSFLAFLQWMHCELRYCHWLLVFWQPAIIFSIRLSMFNSVDGVWKAPSELMWIKTRYQSSSENTQHDTRQVNRESGLIYIWSSKELKVNHKLRSRHQLSFVRTKKKWKGCHCEINLTHKCKLMFCECSVMSQHVKNLPWATMSHPAFRFLFNEEKYAEFIFCCFLIGVIGCVLTVAW